MAIAVVYVPGEGFARFAYQCLAHVDEAGYELAGVVTDRLREVHAMLGSGAADVAVIARPDHVHPNGGPRIEVAHLGAQPGAQVGARSNAPTHRRPNSIALRPAVPMAEPGMTSTDVMRRLASAHNRRPRSR